MKRKIIKIDENLCNGCGLCAEACHEGAIGMENGKAKLLRDDYCDGLGDCLPVCPTGAITFEEREAAPYDAALVQQRMAGQGSGCPGTAAKALRPPQGGCPGSMAQSLSPSPNAPAARSSARNRSELRQWPVQIKLMPLSAPYYDGADILIAADCTAYAFSDFHDRFMRGRITLIGCPKLDEGDYAEKLTALFAGNNIRSVTVVRMEVPCCGGISAAAQRAVADCGKDLPLRIITLSTGGEVLNEEEF